MESTLETANLSVEQLEALLEQKKAEKVKQEAAEREAYEALRNQTVEELIEEAEMLQSIITTFKRKALESMQAMGDLLRKHSKRHGEDVKSFTIYNKSNTKKIVLGVDELGTFDERSKEAVRLIMEFLKKKYANDDDTKEVMMRLLKYKKGELDVKRVQDLYAIEGRFTDPEWKEGIRLLKESWRPMETKTYINFYKRQESDGAWKLVNLQFSGL
jgi:hypothetical protein